MSPANRVRAFRKSLKAAGDAEFAEFHQGYHKSKLKFYGIKTSPLRDLEKDAFPKKPRLSEEELREIVRILWASNTFEERMTALNILIRLAKILEAKDLAWLKSMANECEGWAMLDTLACKTISNMAWRIGRPLYEEVYRWRKSPILWTRRASILVHIMPSRKQELAEDFAWTTFEQLLSEEDFFIRKAIGWTLREISKKYPQAVHDFLIEVGERASPLTRKEGARNLPDELRVPILGK